MGGERVLFVSDVHLTPTRPDVFEAFCRFLDVEAAGAKALYVLGDLFDFFIGEKQLRLPAYEEVFRRLEGLAEAGTRVLFQQGNRDYALDDPFAASRGIELLPDVAETELGGRRVVLTHGDLLCTRDYRYHRMRRVIRSRFGRAVLRGLPLRAAIRVAGGFRGASNREIRRKPAYVLEPDYAEAKAWLEKGYDVLIFGHVHKGEHYRVQLPDREAEVFILGSWEDLPNLLVFDGENLALLPWDGPPNSL
jgi:UDP-2,3-diacylglucosamine hydrolase